MRREAERARLADRAITADRAALAEHALNADLAVRVEEKVPFDSAHDFRLVRTSPGHGEETLTYPRPSGVRIAFWSMRTASRVVSKGMMPV